MMKSLKSFKIALTALPLVVFAPMGLANTDVDKTVDMSGLSGSYLAARVAATDNDDQAAVAFYKKALSLDPDNAELKRNLFTGLIASGQVSEAIEIAPDISGTDTTNTLSSLLASIEALRQRAWSKVGAPLDGFGNNDLENLTAQIIRAWAKVGAGKIDEAVEIADGIKGPDWTGIIRDYHVGLMATNAKNDKLASTRFQRVIENRGAASVLSDTYLRAAEGAVRSLLRQGDAEGAQKALDAVLEIFPNDPSLNKVAMAMKAGEKPGLLIKSVQAGVAELLFNIAAAVGRDGGSTFAKTYLRLADHLSPKMDVVSLALGDILGRQKKYQEANEAYGKIPETSTRYRQAQLGIGLNYDSLGETEKSIEALRGLVENDPKDLIGYLTLGSVFHRKERYAEAAAVYEEAVEMIGAPKNYHWNLFYRRGMAYERLKQWEKAEPSFKLALELFPNQPEVLNYLGYSWVDMGINLDEGMAMIEKAVELRPNAGFIIDSLGWAHYRIGEYEKAVKELERAVQLMPQDATINDHLGDAYWQVGRKLEATFQWRHALTAKPEPEIEAVIRDKLKNGLKTPQPTTAQNTTPKPEEPKTE